MNSPSKWLVKVDKDFVLTDEQVQVLKKAANAGKTMVWFEDVMISLPHIKFMERIKSPSYPKTPLLPEGLKDRTEDIKKLKSRLFGPSR